MAFTATDYISDAAELYGDTGYDRVSVPDWIRYLNASIRALLVVRPDAGATEEAYQLSAGIKQTIPTDALRLLDIPRNMGSDGSSPGKIITPSDRKHIDYANLMWPAATGETHVDNFSYDANNPRTFYVTPPVSSTADVYVEIVTSKLPTAIVDEGDSVGINDVFFEPIINYMLYKAYSADDEDVEFQKAMQYQATFFKLLGIEAQMARAEGPEVKE